MARASSRPERFVNTQLSDALQTQDMAAIALALRNGPTVVPLNGPVDRDRPMNPGEVWTYRDPDSGQIALLLFSDAENKPASLPATVALQSPLWLKNFLTAHEETITTVFFDIAGPHAMQASPADLLKALTV